MQTDSTKSKSNEIKSKHQLNINAPVFEPRFQSLNSKSSDPIWSNFQIPGNSKSTMLVQPMRQNTNVINCPTYLLPSFNPTSSVKVDYAGHSNGNSTAFYCLPQLYIDPTTVIAPQSQIISLHPPPPMAPPSLQTFNKTAHNSSLSASSLDQKEIPISSHTTSSTSHSRNDQSTFTQCGTPQSLNFGLNHSLVIPQNNLCPSMWQSCPQSSHSVALFPTYYQAAPHPHNVFFIQSPQIYAPVNSAHMITQNKSTSKMSIRNKVFNTGDPKLDKVLNELVKRINPVDEFVFRSTNSRFFVIKSFTEDNIYQSIVHGVWCSTQAGNEILVSAYNEVKSRELADDETTQPHVYLFFSVNGSGYFCGVAEMTSTLHSDSATSSVWNQKKWQNQFSIRWLYIKDVPNSYLRQVKLESNDNRPVTNCRDATEILPTEKGVEVLRIIHNIHYDTCLLNDFTQDSTVKPETS